MRQLINGKVYDTETMRKILKEEHYTNGNYCGSLCIGKTPRGNYALICTSNGQDLYRKEYIQPIGKDIAKVRAVIADHYWTPTDEEMETLLKDSLVDIG